MPRVDLNIDLGELAGESQELYALATVVNIACGGHAGDLDSMRRAVELATRFGARIAAHPSYPDRENFGRVRMELPLGALYEAVVDQVAALAHVVHQAGATLWGAKPHGALYHAAADDPRLAAVLLDAVVAAWPNRLVVVGPAGGHLAAAADERELGYAREGFADRRYTPSGQLVPRGEADAVLTTPPACAEQALRLARSGNCDTLCVHGDSPGAVAIAQAVRGALLRDDLLSAS